MEYYAENRGDRSRKNENKRKNNFGRLLRIRLKKKKPPAKNPNKQFLHISEELK